MEQISVLVVFLDFFSFLCQNWIFLYCKKTYLLVFSHLVVAATSDEGNFLRQNIPGAASATPATSEAVASEAAGGGNSSWMLYIISETVILKGKINQSLTNLYKLS